MLVESGWKRGEEGHQRVTRMVKDGKAACVWVCRSVQECIHLCVNVCLCRGESLDERTCGKGVLQWRCVGRQEEEKSVEKEEEERGEGCASRRGNWVVHVRARKRKKDKVFPPSPEHLSRPFCFLPRRQQISSK